MVRPNRFRWGFAVLCMTALLASATDLAFARNVTKAKPAPIPPTRDAAIVVDGASGRVLYSRNADSTRKPASLTKMMTLYLLFEELDEGNITLDAKLTSSAHAAAQEPTKLSLRPGEQIDVDTAIKAITVLSANDVAVMIAEHIGKSESAFAARMTAKARELGMSKTNFNNASGLPDDKQYTTAKDMALLGRHLAYDFPQYYGYFSTPSFSYEGRTYLQHDHLLGQFAGADGIKTGFTRASGFNLVSSAVRNNKHIVGVVMGGLSYASRDAEMVRLLSAAFDFAAQNPTVLADANAPWQGGKGPVADPFNTRTAEPNVMIASLNLQPVTVQALTPVPPKPRIAPKEPPQIVVASEKAPPPEKPTAPTVVASAKARLPTNVVMPVPKPTIMASLPYTVSPIIPYAARSAEARTMVVPFALAASRATSDVVMASATATSRSAPPKVVQSDVANLSLALGTSTPAAPAAKRWSIQIGAYATESLAERQLAALAKANTGVVGGAEHIVAPFTSFDGRTLYRARFGPFAENQARDICNKMIRRGQTCFATAQLH